MKKKAKEKDSSKKRLRSYSLLLIFLICILMALGCFAMLTSYSDTIEEESGNIAQQSVENTTGNLRSSVDVYLGMARNLGEAVLNGEYEDARDFTVQLHRMSRRDSYGDIAFVRYCKDGEEYNVSDDAFNSEMEAAPVREMLDQGIMGCAGVVADRQFSLSVVAYCIPLDDDGEAAFGDSEEKFDYADALVVFYPVSSVVSYAESLSDANYTNSRYTVICTPDGEVVRMLFKDSNYEVDEHGNIFETVRQEFNDKTIYDDLIANVNTGTSGKYFETVNGETTIVSISCLMENNETIFTVVGYYSSADIYPSGYFVIRAILGAMFILFAIAFLIAVVVLIQRYRHRKMLEAAQDTNSVLGCNSRPKFEKIATEILQKNPGTNFAVVVTDINHFEYFSDQLGYDTMLQSLKHLQLIYSRLMQMSETYGYIDNGRFVLLLHYRELETLESRINSAISLATQRSGGMSGNFTLALYGGIYITERGITDSVSKMIELAIEAEKATKYQYDFGNFRYYSELHHASTIQNEYIEVNMYKALENHDFKVFYQPKYNILDRRPDGCEALVRWYNPERDEYMQPGVFMPLFEANGFIMDLDHYVFEQVCLYVEDAVMNGLPLFPISVNASRITATDRDFVKYYTEVKQKHNIADGFFTIEFTESFAYEDYDMLRDIVSELHKAGFKCSIDDFGSGFSSYNILKELPMDEIKLDQFFIKQGFSPDRDIKVLTSIISLARELHMKVTQEGVEHADQVEALRALGCQVVQGYYYSKPLSLTDYIGFLSNDKKI